MDQVNWWLIGLAFVLGLLLTFVLTIRSVKREVPVSSSTGPATAGGAVGDAVESETAKIKTASISTAEETATTKIPASGEAPTTKIETTGAAAAESKTEKSESESKSNKDTHGD
jgi:uncharacterized membrane protein ArfC